MAKHGKYARRIFTASSLRLAIFRSRVALQRRAYASRFSVALQRAVAEDEGLFRVRDPGAQPGPISNVNSR